MREQPHDAISLFGQSGCRKYLNPMERQRFLAVARLLPPRRNDGTKPGSLSLFLFSIALKPGLDF